MKSPAEEDNGKMYTWFYMDEHDILTKLAEAGSINYAHFKVAYHLRRLKPHIKFNYLIGLTTHEVRRLITVS